MDILFKRGTVVAPSGRFRADVGVRDGRIALLGEDLGAEAGELVDAGGKYILPGAVDAHVHLSMISNGVPTADDYFTGTRAAACGGTTTVIDYAAQRKGQGILESVGARIDMARGQACVDYAFHCILTDLHGGALLDEFGAAAAAGITSFKCFTVYKREGLMMADGDLSRVLVAAARHGILTNVHAENADLLYSRVASFLADGKTSAWYHYLSRPEFVEAEADRRVVHWAKALGVPVYLVHLACAEGLEAVAEARGQGFPVYAETCPQYLAFDSEVYKRPDGANFVCSPPIKGAASREALWRGLRTGSVSTVATDHCPFTLAQKAVGHGNFVDIPNGCPGVETMYPYMLSAAQAGKISLEKAVEVCAANPARLFGLPTKGAVAPGLDADLVLYDPDAHVTVTQTLMHSSTDHTIWEGLSLTGYPERVYARGALVFDRGRFTGHAGHGVYCKRVPGGALR
ncbi:MAG: dihydropyrimidinase [Oscillospiraceae bacterium]|nr:dihydropyrimidinase [Oscillospiraceae bacterium]